MPARPAAYVEWRKIFLKEGEVARIQNGVEPRKADRSGAPRRSPYTKPDLKKGPKLPTITAITKGSPGVSFCWVARAAFGDRDLRWLIFRAWLLEDAPAWFRAVLDVDGEEAGRWLRSRPNARQLVRFAMGFAVRRKLAS